VCCSLESRDCNPVIPNPGILVEFTNPIIPGLVAFDPRIYGIKKLFIKCLWISHKMSYSGITSDKMTIITCSSQYTLQFCSLQMLSVVTVCHNLLTFLSAVSINWFTSHTQCKFDQSATTFAVSGPTCWNALPSELKLAASTIDHFCSRLKTVLFIRSYYARVQPFITVL